jgi:hypothetical protein
MHGVRCRPGLRNTRCSADRHNLLKARGATARTIAHPQAAQCLTGRPLEKTPSAYPKRSLLRCGLDICSISQSIHTKAVPRPTTTPKNSSVRPGAVSMLTIREPIQPTNANEVMQAAYQRAASKKRPRCKIHQGRINHLRCAAPQLYLTGPDGSPAIEGGSSISRRPGPGDSACRSASARVVAPCSSRQCRIQCRNRNRCRRSPDSRSRSSPDSRSRSRSRNHRGRSRTLQIGEIRGRGQTRG